MEERAVVIGNRTAQRFLTVDDVIQRVEETWRWYGEGKIVMPPKVTTDMRTMAVDGWFNSMPCYIEPVHMAGIKVVGGYGGNRALGLPYIKATLDMRTMAVDGWFNSMPCYIEPVHMAGIKVVGGYGGNRALGLPYIKATLLLTDPESGILKAVIGGDWISDMRTGAQPAVMAKHLAASTDIVTIIGAGLQGYASLLCMSRLLKLREVRVCDLSAEQRKAFIARFPDAPFQLVEYEDTELACRDSDVIITVTTADATLVKESFVKPGALVMTMGSYRETDGELVRRADMLGVDHIAQALHRGNFKEPAERGEITAESFGAVMPEVLAGRQPGRVRAEDRICAQLVGMGCLDVAVSALLYERVKASGEEMPMAEMDR